LLHYVPQFFQIITAALFVPPFLATEKGNQKKLGQKSPATQNRKHGNSSEKDNSNHARRPAGHGQEIGC
jgi:hypothetical protein